MSRSLGVLSLDLVTKIGGFEQGFDKAQRVADKKLRQIEREAQARAKAIEDAFKSIAGAVAGPLAAAFSVDAIVGYTRQLVQTGVEINRLSQLAGTSAENFQQFAYGAKQAGVPMEKFADIMKDVQDKVGEFLNTGGGPLKDFFTIIAPKIGLTAKAFENLSGPQALQLFYKSLEQANLSQSEMVFYLEAIANDATLLQPLLKNNAQGFKDSAAEAENLGLVIKNEVIQASTELSKNWDTLGQSVQVTFIPVLGALIKQLAGVSQEFLNAKRAGIGFLGAIKGTFTDGLDDPDRSKRVAQWRTEEAKLRKELEGRTGASFGGESQTASMKARIAELQRFQKFAELQDKSATDALAGQLGIDAIDKIGQPTGAPIRATPKPKAAPKGSTKAEYEPLAEAAKAYDKAMAQLVQTQATATLSGQDLTRTQTSLLELMISPEWLMMPETWRVAIAEQGEYVIGIEKAAAEQARLNELIAATPTAQLERLRQAEEFLGAAFHQGKISAEQLNEAVAALGNTQGPQQIKESFLDLATVANDAARGMAGAIADFALSGKASFSDFAESFLSQIAKMIIQAMILKAIEAGMNAFGIGSSPAPAVASASGNVFDGGLKAFASGGVVNSPTFFKFASGGGFRNGLMGEAGPEAIMPLKRDSSGKLGVVASGGGSSVVVNVHNNANGTQAEARQSQDGNGNITLDIIVEQIEGKMSQNIARGRSPFGQTIEGLYGLNRARGAVR